MTTKQKFAELKKLFADVTDEELKPDHAGKPSKRLSSFDKHLRDIHARIAVIRLGMTQRPVLDDRIGQKSKKPD